HGLFRMLPISNRPLPRPIAASWPFAHIRHAQFARRVTLPQLSSVAENQKQSILSAILPRHEGRYGQSSRNVGRDAMDVWTAPDERGPRVRRNRVVPMPRRWHQVMGDDPRTTEAIKPGTPDGTPGRARISRNTIAQGMPDCFGVPVVTCL